MPSSTDNLAALPDESTVPIDVLSSTYKVLPFAKTLSRLKTDPLVSITPAALTVCVPLAAVLLYRKRN